MHLVIDPRYVLVDISENSIRSVIASWIHSPCVLFRVGGDSFEDPQIILFDIQAASCKTKYQRCQMNVQSSKKAPLNVCDGSINLRNGLDKTFVGLALP
jgi:hypothetical protein